MSTWGEAFPSRFYKATDFDNGPKVLTVANVVMEPIGDDGAEKPIIYFKETGKALACNRTNADVIEGEFGETREAVIGKKIELYRSTTRMKGQMMPCVRVAIPRDRTADTGIKTGIPASDDINPDVPF